MKHVNRIVLVTMLIGVLLIPSLTFSQELNTRQPKPNEIGMKAWCPIMDYNFEVKASTSVIDYKGKSFYFCCEGCPAEFKKDPDKYMAQTEFRERQAIAGGNRQGSQVYRHESHIQDHGEHPRHRIPRQELLFLLRRMPVRVQAESRKVHRSIKAEEEFLFSYKSFFPDTSLMAIQGSRKRRMIAILVTAMPA